MAWWFANHEEQKPVRVLTAAARRMDLGSKKEARQMRELRQGWQSDAFTYYDAIGELHYALDFLANCAARMRIYPAAYPAGGESDDPIALSEMEDVPPEVLELATRAISELGHGKMAIKGIMRAASVNTSVAGEYYLLGQQDPESGEESWTIRSVDEIIVKDQKWQMREVPMDPSGDIPWINLDPDTSVVSRIWTPHPRFRLLAASPCKPILEECEALLIWRRWDRAAGRSRLANSGILKVPDELSLKVPLDDDSDPEADPFMSALAQAMQVPVSDEGVSSARVPIVIRGPAEALSQLEHLDLTSPIEGDALKVREERLLGSIATGIDLPKEIITGIADLNHWSSWQVDDNTFRHHVEPHVITICDGLTGAFLRPYLEEFGCPAEWVRRLVFWYDPTELVTHPDQTKDALELHDRGVISNTALLKVAGFRLEDAPTPAQYLAWLISKQRTWPANLSMGVIHDLDPALVVPPITVTGTVPGIKATGVDTGPVLPVAGVGASPEAPGGERSPASPAAQESIPAPERPEQGPPTQTAPIDLTALAVALGAQKPTEGKASPYARRISQKLVGIDQDLRARLHVAANAAMLRQLERAGVRVKKAVARDETLRASAAGKPTWLITASLGREVVIAAGLDANELLGADWNKLKGQFLEWTEQAQKQAVSTALRLAELDGESDAARAAQTAMDAGRESAWGKLAESMTHLAHSLLYTPGEEPLADINPDTIVPTGLIRGALAIAGGGDVALDPGGVATIALGEPVGQIGTGSTIRELIEGAGGEQEGYEWQHSSMAITPFEPHEELDGVQFAEFDSETLANRGDWPENSFFFPGDHDGCGCDYMPIMLSPSEVAQSNGGSS